MLLVRKAEPQNQLTECLEPFSVGGDVSLGAADPPGSCSCLGFLSAVEWGQVRQAARHLSGGAVGVGRPFSLAARHLFQGVVAGIQGSAAVGAAALRELVDFALADGLHEVEGWLDFEQAAEDLEALENDVWNGGTTLNEVKLEAG